MLQGHKSFPDIIFWVDFHQPIMVVLRKFIVFDHLPELGHVFGPFLRVITQKPDEPVGVSGARPYLTKVFVGMRTPYSKEIIIYRFEYCVVFAQVNIFAIPCLTCLDTFFLTVVRPHTINIIGLPKKAGGAPAGFNSGLRQNDAGGRWLHSFEQILRVFGLELLDGPEKQQAVFDRKDSLLPLVYDVLQLASLCSHLFAGHKYGRQHDVDELLLSLFNR